MVATTKPLTIESTINKQREVEGRGGYGETTQRGTTTCTQQSNRLHGGGVVGDNDDNKGDNDNDDDSHDDDNNDHDNDADNGRCGGQDGHHRMKKGRGHDDRTNTTIK